MFSRHLLKMLIGLLGMGLFGLILLFITNLYEKDSQAAAPAASSSNQTVVPHDPKMPDKPCLAKKGSAC
jgi:hypothetical protein